MLVIVADVGEKVDKGYLYETFVKVFPMKIATEWGAFESSSI